jgi:hypothetical protein
MPPLLLGGAGLGARHHGGCDQKRCSAYALKKSGVQLGLPLRLHTAMGQMQVRLHQHIVHLIDTSVAISWWGERANPRATRSRLGAVASRGCQPHPRAPAVEPPGGSVRVWQYESLTTELDASFFGSLGLRDCGSSQNRGEGRRGNQNLHDKLSKHQWLQE